MVAHIILELGAVHEMGVTVDKKPRAENGQRFGITGIGGADFHSAVAFGRPFLAAGDVQLAIARRRIRD